jgi:probable selenium-dependent hydroxylase accessory protein YqeC
MMIPVSRPPGWIPLCQALDLTHGGVVTLVGAGGKTTLMFALARRLASQQRPVLTTTTTKIQLPPQHQSPHLLEVEHAADLLYRLDRLDTIPAHLTALAPEAAQPGKRKGLAPAEIDILSASGRFRWIIVEGDGAARKPLKAPAEHEPVIPASCTHVIVLAGLDGIGRPLDDSSVHRAALFAKLSGLTPGEAVTPEALAKVLTHPLGGRKGVPGEARMTLFLNKADRWSWQPEAQAVGRYLSNNQGADLRVIAGSAQKGGAVVVMPWRGVR